MDNRKNNKGTVSADEREWALIRRFIQIVRKDFGAAERMFDHEKDCLR